MPEQLERRHAEPDPRRVLADEELNICLPDVQDSPDQLRRYREALPVTVPAWMLDGHSAHAAGFIGVVPADRKHRAPAYVVDPGDTVSAAAGPLRA